MATRFLVSSEMRDLVTLVAIVLNKSFKPHVFKRAEMMLWSESQLPAVEEEVVEVGDSMACAAAM
jgi:hypothetical protein